MKKLLLACALLLAVPAVFAQDYYPLQDYGLRKNTTRVEFYGGMVVPQEGWNDHDTSIDLGKTGWSAGIAFQRNLVNFFSLGLDANYAQLGDNDKEEYGKDLRTGIATALVSGRVNFFPSSATRLYIPFGAGIGHVFSRQQIGSSHETYSGTKFAQMVGMGLEFDIDADVIFGLEGRYYLVDLTDDLKPVTNRNRLHYIDVLLKLGFRF